MMGHGPPYIKAAIHGIIVNTLHALLTIPQIMDNGKLYITLLLEG